MKDRQFVTPVLVRDGEATPLRRVPFDERTFDELALQDLLFAHPAVIPVGDIEPLFAGLRPLARELPVGGGFLDLIFMNGEGYLTLVETKLWRNPEARRTVVAQIIDYASNLSTWTYDDLRQAVLSCRNNGTVASSDPLVDLASDGDDDVDEQEFVDRMNRNLRLGRFVLLIVGDGIHEGVEKMADFLNQTPQLQFTLGLVEMGLYALDDKAQPGDFFVQPRIMARTREVTRAVVEIKTTVQPGIIVTVPPTPPKQGERRPITERAFLDQLSESSSSEVVKFAEWVLEQAPAHDLTITWGEAGPLLRYEDAETGHRFTFGKLSKLGTLGDTHWLGGACQRRGFDASIYQSYLDQVAALIPGATRRRFRTPKGTEREHVAISDGPKKGSPPLAALVTHGPEWFEIIDATVRKIREALENRDDSAE